MLDVKPWDDTTGGERHLPDTASRLASQLRTRSAAVVNLVQHSAGRAGLPEPAEGLRLPAQACLPLEWSRGTCPALMHGLAVLSLLERKTDYRREKGKLLHPRPSADMKALEEEVRAIHKDGLLWGACESPASAQAAWQGVADHASAPVGLPVKRG